jgi:hypothetical protein
MRLTWLPGRHEAGIAITDDPDNGQFSGFKTIYDLLKRLRLPVTRAMWAFERSEPTGTPPLPITFFAPTLSDRQCLAYCKELQSCGFEICLHGASSGNNTRERTAAAIEFIHREIGPLRTFICHSKNAENLYWDRKCAPSPFLTFLVGKYVANECFGEVEGSRYFWGDICRNTVSYIRLFRTRQTNTLAFNPSMPYHDFSKPFVNFWFSASKGYLPRLCDPRRIDDLCAQRGAGIFYQYLHKYVDSNGAIDPRVQDTFERLAGDGRLLVMPVSGLLDRLRQARRVFLVSHRGKAFLINAAAQPYTSVQILLDKGESFEPENHRGEIGIESRRALFKAISGLTVVPFQPVNPVKIARMNNLTMHADIAEMRFTLGAVVANCSSEAVDAGGKFPRLRTRYPLLGRLAPYEVKVFYSNAEAERLEYLEPIPALERYRVFFGQAKLLLREHILLGRKISVSSYLKDTGKVEDQANW